MRTNEIEFGTSDKSHYQKWLATDENFTHSIHIQPSSISEQSMYKIFDKVNWELCKSFCKVYDPTRFGEEYTSLY